MHASLKKEFGRHGILRAINNPDQMIRDFMDSSHGRHMEGMSLSDIMTGFVKFKKKYDPKMFESLETDTITLGEAKSIDNCTLATYGLVHTSGTKFWCDCHI